MNAGSSVNTASPSLRHHTPTTTVVSISRPKTWSRRAHSTRSLGPASPRSRCHHSLCPAPPLACSSDQRPASMGCNRVVRGRHRERERGRLGTRAQHEVRRTQAPRVLPRARRSPVRALTRRPSSHAPPKAHAPPSVPRSLAWQSVTFCAAAGGSGRPLRVTARSISRAISTMLGPTPSSAW